MGAGRPEDLARGKIVLDGVGNDESAVRQSQNAQLVSYSLCKGSGSTDNRNRLRLKGG